MAIRLTRHASEAMEARGIILEWIEAALALPDWTAPDPSQPACARAYKAIPAFGGRILRGVLRPDGADIVVITVHPDRNAKP
jgi:hypothetical protein